MCMSTNQPANRPRQLLSCLLPHVYCEMHAVALFPFKALLYSSVPSNYLNNHLSSIYPIFNPSLLFPVLVPHILVYTGINMCVHNCSSSSNVP
ncbi:hypothetical protein B0T17DRAFT_520922 [Bombardia bombarda]|uniref:Uncharacterized protein n=1 Tax=Bombardia bombarda TaxID=252184 RepID=A0AA40CGB6_9PEZI|nr:hypothetical protein B0T17DRAFT_520922 [Bombardia bombarda]